MNLEEMFYEKVVALTEERDCDKHTVALRVTFNPGQAVGIGSPDIIAGLLRVLATHVDGFCAVRAAKDADFRDPGMTFHFTSDTHRQTFRRLCTKYLRKRVDQALVFTDL